MDIQINDKPEKIQKIVTDQFEHMLSRYDYNIWWEEYDLYINGYLYYVQSKTKVQHIVNEGSKLMFVVFIVQDQPKKQGLIIDEINQIYTNRRFLDPSEKHYDMIYSSYQNVQKMQRQLTQKSNNVYQADLHARIIRVPILCKYSDHMLILFEVDQEIGEDRVLLSKNDTINTFKQDDPNNQIINEGYPASENLILYFDYHNVYVYWDNLQYLLVIEWENKKRTVKKIERKQN